MQAGHGLSLWQEGATQVRLPLSAGWQWRKDFSVTALLPICHLGKPTRKCWEHAGLAAQSQGVPALPGRKVKTGHVPKREPADTSTLKSYKPPMAAAASRHGVRQPPLALGISSAKGEPEARSLWASQVGSQAAAPSMNCREVLPAGQGGSPLPAVFKPGWCFTKHGHLSPSLGRVHQGNLFIPCSNPLWERIGWTPISWEMPVQGTVTQHPSCKLQAPLGHTSTSNTSKLRGSFPTQMRSPGFSKWNLREIGWGQKKNNFGHVEGLMTRANTQQFGAAVLQYSAGSQHCPLLRINVQMRPLKSCC